jgi:hypothetical protein
MNIRIWIADEEGIELKDLGTCTTDSPNRALQMYEDDLDTYLERGVSASLRWAEVE